MNISLLELILPKFKVGGSFTGDFLGDCLILSGVGSLAVLGTDANALAYCSFRKSSNVPNIYGATLFPNLVSKAFGGKHS